MGSILMLLLGLVATVVFGAVVQYAMLGNRVLSPGDALVLKLTALPTDAIQHCYIHRPVVGQERVFAIPSGSPNKIHLDFK